MPFKLSLASAGYFDSDHFVAKGKIEITEIIDKSVRDSGPETNYDRDTLQSLFIRSIFLGQALSHGLLKLLSSLYYVFPSNGQNWYIRLQNHEGNVIL